MKDYQKLFSTIGFEISDKKLLKEAFTHRSAVNESAKYSVHNERLEFLGDAVLELISTEYLFKNYPKMTEGDMTNIRSALVKGEHLAKIAKFLDLGVYLILSKGEDYSGGRKKEYLLANVMEAFVGVIYLDQGFEITKKFIKKFVFKDLKKIIKEKSYIDAKSQFQEFAQAKLGITPAYKVLSSKGKDHDKTFVMGAFLEDKKCGEGSGRSKKDAQISAATNALKNKKKWFKK